MSDCNRICGGVAIFVALMFSSSLATPAVLAQAPAAKTPVIVDLKPYQAQISKLIDDSVSELLRDHPDATISMFALDYSGYNPFLTIWADTTEKSDAHVKKFPDYAEKDADGSFNGNPPDMKYELADFEFEGFPDLNKLKAPLSLKYPDGRIVALERGDEALYQAMFDFVLPILQKSEAYKRLKRAPVFRLGVHVQDSAVGPKYWRVPK